MNAACPAGTHDTRDECDSDPWCPADDPGCFGTRCDDHDHCVPSPVPFKNTEKVKAGWAR